MTILNGGPYVLLLLVSAGSVASVSAAPMNSQDTPAQATRDQPKANGQISLIPGRRPSPKGRLKFKSGGPVCMCGEGMSERDIERLTEKLKENRAAGSESVTTDSQDTGK